VEEILKHAAEPIFVLNERGALVMSNPAFDDRTGFRAVTLAEKVRWVTQYLQPPRDLPPGQARSAVRPLGEGEKRRWWTIIFVAMRTREGDALGTLGLLSEADEPIAVPRARDSVAEEQLARLAERQRSAQLQKIVIAQSAGMKRVVQQIHLAAGSDVPVLIEGEAGAGKRMVAHQIRARSSRSARPMVIIEAQSLSPEIQKSQFLDVARISFESLEQESEEERYPILEDPNGGTLLIHDAGGLAGELQARLVELSAADSAPRWRLILTERELPDRLRAAGKWSDEFYHLVTRLVIPVPALRERREDLPLLSAQVLLQPELVNSVGTRVAAIEPAAMARLAAYDFPGNVAELEQIVHRACRRATKSTLVERDFPKFLSQADRLEVPADPSPLPALNEVLDSVEKRLIALSLQRHRGNKSKAAKELGISRPRLHRRAQELGFSDEPVEENLPKEDLEDEEMGKDDRS
jgi:DNA-binding NtrC family response regulator